MSTNLSKNAVKWNGILALFQFLYGRQFPTSALLRKTGIVSCRSRKIPMHKTNYADTIVD